MNQPCPYCHQPLDIDVEVRDINGNSQSGYTYDPHVTLEKAEVPPQGGMTILKGENAEGFGGESEGEYHG